MSYKLELIPVFFPVPETTKYLNMGLVGWLREFNPTRVIQCAIANGLGVTPRVINRQVITIFILHVGGCPLTLVSQRRLRS